MKNKLKKYSKLFVILILCGTLFNQSLIAQNIVGSYSSDTYATGANGSSDIPNGNVKVGMPPLAVVAGVLLLGVFAVGFYDGWRAGGQASNIDTVKPVAYDSYDFSGFDA